MQTATETSTTLRCEVSNHWRDEAPEHQGTVSGLLRLLAEFPLDPRFEEYGNFVGDTMAGKEQYEDGKTIFVPTGPIYPEHPNAVRFWGNFYCLSAVFCIDTDDAGLISLLTKAIRDNQATAAYVQAKAEIAKPGPWDLKFGRKATA